MSSAGSGSRRDLAVRLLAAAVRLLPTRRREWGQAMLADLAGVTTGRARRRFVMGCVGAILRRPSMSAVGHLGLRISGPLVVVVLTLHSAYLPMRIGLIAMATVLTLTYVGCERIEATRRSSHRRSSHRRSLRFIRAAAAAVIAGLALNVVINFRAGTGAEPNVVDRAHFGIAMITAVFVCYIVGLVAMTAEQPTDRFRPAIDAGLGASGALVWLVAEVLLPPLPLSPWSTIVALIAVAGIAAGLGTEPGGTLPAALAAGMTFCLCAYVAAKIALSYGPSAWVPPDSAALTASDRLAQSRSEAADTYIGLVLIGAVLAAALCLVMYAHTAQPADRTRRIDVAAG